MTEPVRSWSWRDRVRDPRLYGIVLLAGAAGLLAASLFGGSATHQALGVALVVVVAGLIGLVALPPWGDPDHSRVLGAAIPSVLAIVLIVLTLVLRQATMTPQAWSAVASCTTAVLAVIALVATVPQYRQAKQGAAQQVEEQRRLAREQARPYVAVSLEFGLAAPAHMVQFVVSNLGHTSAKDVCITSDPPLQRAQPLPVGGREEVFVPSTFPTVVPGQRWATFWDMGPERHGSGLPDRHDVTVTYTDGRGANYTDTFVLDWTTIWNQRQMPPKSTHDAATALLEIAETLQTWTERSGPGLQVWQRDGHRKDEEEQERLAALQQRLRDQADERRLAGVHRPDLDLVAERMDAVEEP